MIRIKMTNLEVYAAIPRFSETRIYGWDLALLVDDYRPLYTIMIYYGIVLFTQYINILLPIILGIIVGDQ